MPEPDDTQDAAVENAIQAFRRATVKSEEAARAAAAAVAWRAEALAALIAVCGTQTEAARRLGMSQSTLSKLLRRVPAGQ